MEHSITSATDSWARFPAREYVDVGKNETILTRRTTQHENRCSDSVSSAAQRMTAYKERVYQTGQEHRLIAAQLTTVAIIDIG